MIVLNLTCQLINSGYKSFSIITEWDDSENNPDMIICDLMSDLIPFERDTWYPKVILHRPSINQGVMKELINNNLVWAYTTTLEELQDRLEILDMLHQLSDQLDNNDFNNSDLRTKLFNKIHHSHPIFNFNEEVELGRLQTHSHIFSRLFKDK